MHATQHLVVYWLLVRPHGGGPDCRCYVDSTTYHAASVGKALPE